MGRPCARRACSSTETTRRSPGSDAAAPARRTAGAPPARGRARSCRRRSRRPRCGGWPSSGATAPSSSRGRLPRTRAAARRAAAPRRRQPKTTSCSVPTFGLRSRTPASASSAPRGGWRRGAPVEQRRSSVTTEGRRRASPSGGVGFAPKEEVRRVRLQSLIPCTGDGERCASPTTATSRRRATARGNCTRRRSPTSSAERRGAATSAPSGSSLQAAAAAHAAAAHAAAGAARLGWGRSPVLAASLSPVGVAD